ncbi:MAG: NAD+ synthase [Chloroflexi bacterium]|nr:NAD+ synthase [Chloroflexota bacterium]
MRTFRLAMAQVNMTVGDLNSNTGKIVAYIEMARAQGADLVAFPELAITGYPPEDLVFKRQFVKDNLVKMHEVVKASKGIAVVVGFIDADTDVYNAAAVACDGKLLGVYRKMHLPNYGVFDEARYFKRGESCPVYVINGITIGVNVCEDIWYAGGPTVPQSRAGADVIVNINGSPFHAGKRTFREKMLATRARDNAVHIAYLNLVGGQDELVFDGGGMVFDPQGNVLVRGPQFEETLLLADLNLEPARAKPQPSKDKSVLEWQTKPAPVIQATGRLSSKPKPRIEHMVVEPRDELEEIYKALVLGTRDYVHKIGFEKVVIGLSGGIDSSLVAAVAVDGLGNGNVTGVAMPSRFSSEGSLADARSLAHNLDIELLTLPIEASFKAFLETLTPHFKDSAFGLTEENLQSRIRGNLIMALSNKFGWLVLTTGNKSEMATGYATLYGDMSGGFAVIKDVPKTLVYRLCEYRNTLGSKPVIPQSVMTKAPTAELRPNQKDEDSLPPSPVLDPILKAYVEDDRTYEEIVGMGYPEEMVKQVIGLVDRSEYKRRQAPPGVKITPRNFGRDRRMPIANRYKPY